MKRFRVQILFFSTVMLTMAQAEARNIDARDLFFPGFFAASLGRGATGVSQAGTTSFFLNPASIAETERLELAIGHGSIAGDYGNTGIAAAVPSSYGTLGLVFNSIRTDPPEGGPGSIRFASVGGAREFTDRLSIGAALDFSHGFSDDFKGNYAGAALGARYTPAFSFAPGGGFGIFQPSIGAAGRAGVPFGEEKKYADIASASAGYMFSFFRQPNVNISFFNEVAALREQDAFPVKFGLESWLYDTVALRAGLTTPSVPGHSTLSLGAGLLLSGSGLDARLDYSFGYSRAGGGSHFLGLNISHGTLDREPPSITITPNETHISPNYDGRQDFVIFRTSVRDDSRIKGWRLQILSADGDPVREYRLSDRDMEERMTPQTFIKRIWQKKESTVVPEAILWDGTDARGRVVLDGLYRYSFMVWDEHDNISAARTGAIHVDTTAPTIELSADYRLFSPNGDGQKDTLTITQSAVSDPDDQWLAGFRNSSGKTIKSFRWNGIDIPRRVVWDGTDDEGVPAPEGLYSYYIECTDRAGNAGTGTIGEITLTRLYETVDVETSLRHFSPPLHREVSFQLSLSSVIGLEEWRLSLENKGRKTIREFTGGAPLERIVKWDGLDSAGKALPDGIYYYTLKTRFDSGNTPSSYTKEIVLDGTPPAVSLRYSPSLFSPDGDGTNDTLTLYPGATDQFGVARWSVFIYSNAGELFKSFHGQGDPAREIIWDGMSASSELVESAADYFLEIEASDIAGNYAKSRRLRLPVDVLVMMTERGLRIRISNIEFAFDSAKLTGKAFPILRRVGDILERYGAYKVRVEGHTDDIGEEEYNLRLSEERAKAVMDHLISRGIDPSRLSFRGMGETAPFLPNVSEENRRRNRRVEFILVRDEAHD